MLWKVILGKPPEELSISFEKTLIIIIRQAWQMYFEVSTVSKRQLDTSLTQAENPGGMWKAGFGMNISLPEQHVFSSTSKSGIALKLRDGMRDEKQQKQHGYTVI